MLSSSIAELRAAIVFVKVFDFASTAACVLPHCLSLSSLSFRAEDCCAKAIAANFPRVPKTACASFSPKPFSTSSVKISAKGLSFPVAS